MKEIGEKLKEARESIGVSIDEVAEDLKTNESQIIAIENGDSKAFPDVFNLKYFIRDYAKYLGLNKNDIIDEFNEYLFDYTSKLSLDEIKKESKREKENKIKSPYTIERKSERLYQNIVYITIIVVLITIGYVIYNMLKVDKNENIVYGGYYEFTQQNNLF